MASLCHHKSGLADYCLGGIMPIAKTLSCWSVIGVFVVLTAGCYPSEQPQAIQASSVSSAPTKASTSSLAQSTYNQATPSSVASTNGQMVSGQLECKSPQTQAAINTCASSSAEAADQKLNQVYQQLKSALKGSQREKLLIDAELMWVRFRDTNCAFERSNYQGGSIAPSIYYSCIEQMTKQRTEQLESYLKQS